MIESASPSQPGYADAQDWLRHFGERPATVSTLIDLYADNRELFFVLAVEPLRTDAPAWMKDIANLASTVRRFVRYGFRIDDASKQIIGSDKSLYLGEGEFDAARGFLRVLSGTSEKAGPGRDYAGLEVSAAEVRFALGTGEDYEIDKAQAAARNDVRPRLLSLSPEDAEAIRQGMPGYVAHELKLCATRVVQAPTVVFQGLRTKGPLRAGRAYCATPRRAFDNEGNPRSVPAKMVYCVYADPAGRVFDWDWVPEDPSRRGYPKDYQLRFSNQITELGEATLSLPADLTPTKFKKAAWHCQSGDCMFFYASDEPAYAQRVNEELTEYRTFASQELVGCKVKNFSNLMADVMKRLSVGTVQVGAILAASLVRQMESHQEREKTAFLKLFAEAALRMDEDQRQRFFREVVSLDEPPEHYLDKISSMVLDLTKNPDHPVIVYANEAVSSRKAVTERYFNLIAVAGQTSLRRAA
jgi:hypothetical protein